MYALKSLTGNLEDELCKVALADADARVREHGLRLSERPPSDKPRNFVADDVWKLRFDPDPNVRIQFAHSLRKIQVKSTDPAKVMYAEALIFVHLALKDVADPWMRLAILSGMDAQHQGTAFFQLATSQYFRSLPDGPAFILAACELVAADPDGQNSSELGEVVSALALGTRTVRADPGLARSLLRTVRTRGSQKTLTMFDEQNEAQNLKAITEFLAKDAAVTARDVRKPVAGRVSAIRDLQILPFKDAAGVLAETIKATQPPEIQIATLEALGRFGDERTPAIILEAWPAMTPKVRATATEVWLSRNNWVPAFLDAVESRKVARADIDPARAALLKKHPARNIGSRAGKLFAAPADRQKVFEEYRKALELKGDPEKGKLVFKNQCSACHRLDGVGEEVGADLKAIRDRGLEAVLLNIIDPNREVKPQYLAYSAELKNMRVVTGMLAAETATGLTIRRPDGRSESIQRADVENLRSLGVSYMPEGLEKQINVTAMADLLAYLNSIK